MQWKLLKYGRTPNVFALWKRKILIGTAGVCLLFLFVGGPAQFSPRSYNDAWDLGHILVFALCSYLLMKASTKIVQASFLKQSLWFLTMTFVGGTLIELIQGSVNRTPSSGDVLKDLTGSFIILTFWSPSRHSLPKWILRMVQACAIALILFAILPFIKACVDETAAKKQFPVLASFETPFELERWEGNSTFTMTRTLASHGDASLKVLFNTDRYSGVFLRHFPGDWQSFSVLQMDIFNPSTEPLCIHCRVHDRLHFQHGLPYHDRFNSTFTLHQGWNHISIPLEQVLSAPVSRTMDAANICNVGIFVASLGEPTVMYLDHIRLGKALLEKPSS